MKATWYDAHFWFALFPANPPPNLLLAGFFVRYEMVNKNILIFHGL